MKSEDTKKTDNDGHIEKNYDEIEQEKKQKFVNLLIEIIMSLTLK